MEEEAGFEFFFLLLWRDRHACFSASLSQLASRANASLLVRIPVPSLHGCLCVTTYLAMDAATAEASPPAESRRARRRLGVPSSSPIPVPASFFEALGSAAGAAARPARRAGDEFEEGARVACVFIG